MSRQQQQPPNRPSRSPARLQKLAALANLSPAAAEALQMLPARVGRTGAGSSQSRRASCCCEENVHSPGFASRLARCSTWDSQRHAVPPPETHNAAQLQRSNTATRHPDPHPMHAGAELLPAPRHQDSCRSPDSRAFPSTHSTAHIYSNAPHSRWTAAEAGHDHCMLATLTESATENTVAAPPSPPSAPAKRQAASCSLPTHDCWVERAENSPAPMSPATARRLLRSKSSTDGHVIDIDALCAIDPMHSGSSGVAAAGGIKLQAAKSGRRTSQPASLDPYPLQPLRSSPAALMAMPCPAPPSSECCLDDWPAGFGGADGDALPTACCCTIVDSLPGSASSNVGAGCGEGGQDAAVCVLDPSLAAAPAAGDRPRGSAKRLLQLRERPRVSGGGACSCRYSAGGSVPTSPGSACLAPERRCRRALGPALAEGGADTPSRRSRRSPSSIWMTTELGRLSAWEFGQTSSSQTQDLILTTSLALLPELHAQAQGLLHDHCSPQPAAAAEAAQHERAESASANALSSPTAATSNERCSPITSGRSSSRQLSASKPHYASSSGLDDAEQRRASDAAACGFGLLTRLCRRILPKKPHR